MISDFVFKIFVFYGPDYFYCAEIAFILDFFEKIDERSNACACKLFLWRHVWVSSLETLFVIRRSAFLVFSFDSRSTRANSAVLARSDQRTSARRQLNRSLSSCLLSKPLKFCRSRSPLLFYVIITLASSVMCVCVRVCVGLFRFLLSHTWHCCFFFFRRPNFLFWRLHRGGLCSVFSAAFRLVSCRHQTPNLTNNCFIGLKACWLLYVLVYFPEYFVFSLFWNWVYFFAFHRLCRSVDFLARGVRGCSSVSKHTAHHRSATNCSKLYQKEISNRCWLCCAFSPLARCVCNHWKALKHSSSRSSLVCHYLVLVSCDRLKSFHQ